MEGPQPEEKEKRRKRVTIACETCRKHKIRCDFQLPCHACQRLNRPCVYAPPKKRGPKPSSASQAEGIKLEHDYPPTSALIDYYLRVLTGNLGSIFELGRDLIPKQNGSKPLSEGRRFILFAALASCSRCSGNHVLSEQFFRYAQQLSRNFTDPMSRIEEPFEVVVGFCLLGIYTSGFSRSTGIGYLHLAQSVKVRCTLPPDHDRALHFFLTTMDCMMSKTIHRALLAHPVTSHVEQGGSLRLGQTSLPLVALGFPLFQTPEPQLLNQLLVSYASGRPLPRNLPLDGALAIPFVLFFRYQLVHFVPEFANIFYDDHLTPAHLDLPTGTFPVELADWMIGQCADMQTLESRLPQPVLASGILSVLPGVLEYLVGRNSACLQSLSHLVQAISEEGSFEALLLSPPYVFPPYIFISCGIALKLGSIPLYDSLSFVLRHYAKIGLVNGVSGLKALEELRLTLFPFHPVVPSPEPGLTTPPGLVKLESLSLDPPATFSSPSSSSSPPSSPRSQEREHTASDMAGQADPLTQLEEEEEKFLPFDLMMSSFDPANQDKLLGDLGWAIGDLT